MNEYNTQPRQPRSYMDSFGKLAVELVKLVFKIIEAIIRALLVIAIETSFNCICAGMGLLVGFYILRYGVRKGDSYLTSSSVNSLAMVTGCALTLIAAYAIYRMF